MGPLGSQHRLFNEHLVSASSNPALALRRKKHTEKEVPADLVSTVSVRLREGYSIREVTLAKGRGSPNPTAVSQVAGNLCVYRSARYMGDTHLPHIKKCPHESLCLTFKTSEL